MSRLILLTLEYTDDVEILLTILKTVKDIISNDINEIGEQLEDYIIRILKLTQFQNSMVSQHKLFGVYFEWNATRYICQNQIRIT